MAAALGLSQADYDALMAPNESWPYAASEDGACRCGGSNRSRLIRGAVR